MRATVLHELDGTLGMLSQSCRAQRHTRPKTPDRFQPLNLTEAS
jgi:hypothetical protein